jgi:hypothetical protein
MAIIKKNNKGETRYCDRTHVKLTTTDLRDRLNEIINERKRTTNKETK